MMVDSGPWMVENSKTDFSPPSYPCTKEDWGSKEMKENGAVDIYFYF